MNILFSSLPTHGHTYPLLPLAIALRDQGHDVTYATAEQFHPPLTALGLTVVNAGIDIREAFARAGSGIELPEDRNSPEFFEVIMTGFGTVLPKPFATDLAPVFAEHKFDLVVYEAGNPGAGFAAALAGVPAVSHGFGRGGAFKDAANFFDKLAAVATELGLTDVVNEFGLTDPYLDIYPPSLQDKEFLTKANRAPLRPVPFAEPGALPDWVTAHAEPLIYLTLGTAFGDAAVLRTAIDGLAGTGAKVIVAAGPTVSAADLGNPPDNVTVESWVPQADLPPHVDLVVHHGGSGTTLGALGVGVPQLFLPQGADQFINAEAVTGSGAGDQLLADDLSTATVRERAERLLSDQTVAAKATAIADEIAAMPSPSEVAARIADYTVA